MTNIFGACEELKKYISGDKIVVIKSTVPVGTNRKISEIFRRLKTGNVRVLSNPEFLREGSAIDDFMKPDRGNHRNSG